MEVPPYLLHICPGRVGRPHVPVPVPEFQYGVRSVQVRLSGFWLQARPDYCCGLLGSSPRVHQEGAPDGLGEAPRHVAVVARVVFEGLPLLNQPYGVEGHPEGVRGELQGGGGSGSKFLMV